MCGKQIRIFICKKRFLEPPLHSVIYFNGISGHTMSLLLVKDLRRFELI